MILSLKVVRVPAALLNHQMIFRVNFVIQPGVFSILALPAILDLTTQVELVGALDSGFLAMLHFLNSNVQALRQLVSPHQGDHGLFRLGGCICVFEERAVLLTPHLVPEDEPVIDIAVLAHRLLGELEANGAVVHAHLHGFVVYVVVVSSELDFGFALVVQLSRHKFILFLFLIIAAIAMTVLSKLIFLRFFSKIVFFFGIGEFQLSLKFLTGSRDRYLYICGIRLFYINTIYAR